MKIYEAKLTYNLLRLGEEVTLDTPAKIADYMIGAFDDDPTVEWFYVILLDRRNHPIGRTMITKGTATGTLCHAREVFKAAIIASASAVILVHNHPSGDPTPSQADRRVTMQLRQAASILAIDLLDHVIIGDEAGDPCNKGYYSFRDVGMI